LKKLTQSVAERMLRYTENENAKKVSKNLRAKIRESMGLKSPCLKYSEIAKEMVEAAREGQEETYQAK